MKNEEIVCYCSDVTKGDILRALENGARTLSDVRKATGACTKPDCMNKSPRKSCCSPVIMQVIKEYYGIR
ncbi:MAG: (2Fe-2S)-binding protein [Eubacteriales bacterium]|nr:(2Fe-2S)-binding protein [Eubacteriales bacterium]